MKNDSRYIASEMTNKIRELLNHDDIEVYNVNYSMVGLYINNRLIAYCFSHHATIINADIKYKILAPKHTEINYKYYDMTIQTSEPTDIKKIKEQVAMNIKQQEVVLAMLQDEIAEQVLEKLRLALVMHQLSDKELIDLEHLKS